MKLKKKQGIGSLNVTVPQSHIGASDATFSARFHKGEGHLGQEKRPYRASFILGNLRWFLGLR